MINFAAHITQVDSFFWQMSASISASCLTDADAIDLHILRLTGEAFTISVPRTSLGGEVRKLVAQRVASKGRNLSLQHGSKPLVLHQSLEDQGVGPSAALSCVFVPTDLDAAFRFMQGLIDDEFALEGLSKMEGATAGEFLYHLPASLEMLTFGRKFNQSLEGVAFPGSLQGLAFGDSFNRTMLGVTLPSGLRSLTFGSDFNQSLWGVTLPACLQDLTLGERFNHSIQGVRLPSSLTMLTFGSDFNQSLEGVRFPCTLRHLTFGIRFNQSMDRVALPNSLQNLSFGSDFNCGLEGVTLPPSLQSLTCERMSGQNKQIGRAHV